MMRHNSLLFVGLLLSLPLQAMERASVSNTQAQANGNSYMVGSSPDGRYVVFDSMASNLVPGDNNGQRDVFIRDRSLGTIERVSVGPAGIESPYLNRAPSVSADGRYVSFETKGPLLSGSSVGIFQIYRRDRVNGVTELVSASSSGLAGNSFSSRSSISADGRYVLFYSRANNLVVGDNNGVQDIFLKDMQTGALETISLGASGVRGNDHSFEAAMSSDARFISFTSMATNLTGSTIPRQRHVYLRDRQTSTTRLLSRSATGSLANQPAYSPTLSDDGRYVVYYSKASNLTAGTGGSILQIIQHDTQSGDTVLLSRDAAGIEGDDLSYSPSISADGRFVAYTSFAKNLVDVDNNGVSDVLLWDRQNNETTIISQSESGQLGNGAAIGTPALSRSGNSIAFSTYADNLIESDTNNVADIFVRDRVTNAIPVANAGIDQQLQCSGVQTPVSLDGRASTDADGDTLNYAWSLPGGQQNGAVITVPMAVGTHSAILNVDDQRGGISSDSVSIEISDTTAPSLVLAAEQVLEAESKAGSPYALNASSSDLCSGVSLAINPTLSIYPLGETLVNVSASDSHGNTVQASQRIRVEDTIAPVLSVPADIRREADARQMAIDIGSATASDIFDVTIDNDAPQSFVMGSTTVNWSATDSNGNSSAGTQIVTVEDTTAPVFGVINAITQEATTVRTPLVLSTPEVSDIFQVTLSHNAPADYALGNTNVNWRAEDENGNASEAVQLVTIVDTTAPLITVPEDIVVEASGELTAVALTPPASKDIFPVSVRSDAAASLPLGQHTVTWTATDSSGNQSQARQTITVQDTTAPLIEVVSEVVVEAQGSLTPVILPAVNTSDLFAITLSNNAPALFPLGSTMVTWLAVDGNGNQTQALQMVRVVDTTAPSAEVEQLRDTIWPPNNKMVRVARIHNLQDLVDMQPSLGAVVEWEHASDSKHHKRPARHKLERKGLKHADHDRRGAAHSSNTKIKHDAKDRNTRHGKKKNSRKHEKSDWKLVQKGDEWYLYVRASMNGRKHARTYTISISMSDSAGNQSLQTMTVSVEHQHKNKSRHQDNSQ